MIVITLGVTPSRSKILHKSGMLVQETDTAVIVQAVFRPFLIQGNHPSFLAFNWPFCRVHFQEIHDANINDALGIIAETLKSFHADSIIPWGTSVDSFNLLVELGQNNFLFQVLCRTLCCLVGSYLGFHFCGFNFILGTLRICAWTLP